MVCVLWSDFAGGRYHVVVGADGFEVAATATDFLGFGVAEFLEILGGFGLTHEIKDGAVVLEDCPVGVVSAEWVLLGNASAQGESRRQAFQRHICSDRVVGDEQVAPFFDIALLGLLGGMFAVGHGCLGLVLNVLVVQLLSHLRLAKEFRRLGFDDKV